jgi:hypothetical protein
MATSGRMDGVENFAITTAADGAAEFKIGTGDDEG